MSRKGNCWDNAVTESFFHTLKGHVVHGCVFTTRKAANTVLFDYIEIYYNRVRRHSANGWLAVLLIPCGHHQNNFHLAQFALQRLLWHLGQDDT